MKRLILHFSFLTVFLFASCSSPTDPYENAITVQKTENELIVSNISTGTIYLKVIEQGISAHVNWRVHFGKPNVEPYGSISINYSDIFNGGDMPVQSGDKVVVNYWYYSDKPHPKVYSKVIEL